MKLVINTIILMLISFNSFADDNTITLAADSWCPWNCDDPANPGIAVEIAKAIYEPKGYKVEYIKMPWTRAVKEVLAGNYTAAIGASNTDSKDFNFPKSALFNSNNYYAVRKDSDFKYVDDNSLKGKVIGIVQDYHFASSFGKYIDDNYQNKQIVHQISGDNAALLNIKSLVNKRTDIYIDDQYVIKYVAKANNLLNEIKIVDSLQDTESGYMGFSPVIKHSADLVKLWDEGYDKLEKDGTVKKILDKYLN